jgi:two-component system, LytTR family, sensor kinase
MATMPEQHLVTLLVKLAVAAALASVVIRLHWFQRMLMREERTLTQRLRLAFSLAAVFGAGVATRILTHTYAAVDLGLEGSMVAGLVGGYFSGLVSGVLISIPAMGHGELLSMPLFAAVGTLGGLVRDLAPEPEDVWRFSPLFDLNPYRMLRRWRDFRMASFHLFYLGAILLAELIRVAIAAGINERWAFSVYHGGDGSAASVVALYVTTVFAVILPLKVWNNARNEQKLETQQRLLQEARLAALTSQINPHFLFNTLNSVASLIRTNPDQARVVITKLSSILRRLLRKHENLSPLRDELSFIDDYLAIEMVRFGSKLQFSKEVDPAALDIPVPSMLLQPLVENSIRHGLSGKVEGGIIRIRSRIEQGRLHIIVEDNGVGIPETKLATLFEQGIGVSNVNSRLQVLFGNEYRMLIDSRVGEGTRTEIQIPAVRAPLATVAAS